MLIEQFTIEMPQFKSYFCLRCLDVCIVEHLQMRYKMCAFSWLVLYHSVAGWHTHTYHPWLSLRAAVALSKLNYNIHFIFMFNQKVIQLQRWLNKVSRCTAIKRRLMI